MLDKICFAESKPTGNPHGRYACIEASLPENHMQIFLGRSRSPRLYKLVVFPSCYLESMVVPRFRQHERGTISLAEWQDHSKPAIHYLVDFLK